MLVKRPRSRLFLFLVIAIAHRCDALHVKLNQIPSCSLPMDLVLLIQNHQVYRFHVLQVLRLQILIPQISTAQQTRIICAQVLSIMVQPNPNCNAPTKPSHGFGPHLHQCGPGRSYTNNPPLPCPPNPPGGLGSRPCTPVCDPFANIAPPLNWGGRGDIIIRPPHLITPQINRGAQGFDHLCLFVTLLPISVLVF